MIHRQGQAIAIAILLLALLPAPLAAQTCPSTCIQNHGYPWPQCGCLNADALNNAFAPLYGQSSTTPTPEDGSIWSYLGEAKWVYGMAVGKKNWTRAPECTDCNADGPVVVVSGSMSAPISAAGASPAMTVQQYLGAAPGGAAYSALIASMFKTQSVATGYQSARAIFAEVYDTAGWTSGDLNFTEAIRATATCGPAAGVCFANGVTGVSWNKSINDGTNIGFEGEVDTLYPRPSFPGNTLVVSFLATSGLSAGSGAKNSDAGFMVNPNNAQNAIPMNGFICPAPGIGGATTTVALSCFVSDSANTMAIDTHRAPPGNGGYWMPNGGGIYGSDKPTTAVPVSPPRLLVMESATNQALFGYDANLTSRVIGSTDQSKRTIILDTFNLQYFSTPASGTAACTAGDVAHDVNYFYLCNSVGNTWVKAQMVPFTTPMGVTCSGVPSSGFASSNGVVTHC